MLSALDLSYYILKNCVSKRYIEKDRLNILLYLCQSLSLITSNKRMFYQDIFAGDICPVINELDEQYKYRGLLNLSDFKSNKIKEINKLNLKILTTVLNKFLKCEYHLLLALIKRSSAWEKVRYHKNYKDEEWNMNKRLISDDHMKRNAHDIFATIS